MKNMVQSGGGVEKYHVSPKSEVEKGMQLSEKMIAALDKAVEALREEEIRDGIEGTVS